MSKVGIYEKQRVKIGLAVVGSLVRELIVSVIAFEAQTTAFLKPPSGKSIPKDPLQYP